MTDATGIVAWIGAALAVVSMALLFARLRRLPRQDTASGELPRVSIVIPARDEEQNLSRLLPSLGRQTVPPHEVIVVDDQSSDGTAEMVQTHGARLIRGRELRSGWYGKPWACHQGVEASTGDWLLFLDADVELEADALERLLSAAAAEPGAVFSVCPWHRIERAYEELSVFFNLLMVGGIGAFTWRGDQATGIGLFGQTFLVSRKRYGELGGHEAVKQTVLENLKLAKKCEELGIPRRCFVGRGSISMRMFPGGYREMVESWAKGFSSGAALASPAALLLASLWLTGLMMVTVCVFLLVVWDARVMVGAAYLAVAIPTAILFRQVGRFSVVNALLFPVSLLFYQGLFAVAVMRKRKKVSTSWKGRHVD
ncbi:glycosyltransferase [Haloferula rosea]|uniref:Glycosyltransferase n=1 Tax=Haloferula rosea TaxID=490093 RepID=A0A934VF10_9BACT|nr:glycosyltransferase family A protein [Haloferula rosea]MBK1826085.1 glycosyltransferase [Haloferula rosea]